MSNVTHLKKPCDQVLQEMEGKLSDVMVIGWLKDEQGIECASNMSNPDMILLMEIVKSTIIEAHYGYDD